MFQSFRVGSSLVKINWLKYLSFFDHSRTRTHISKNLKRKRKDDWKWIRIYFSLISKNILVCILFPICTSCRLDVFDWKQTHGYLQVFIVDEQTTRRRCYDLIVMIWEHQNVWIYFIQRMIKNNHLGWTWKKLTKSIRLRSVRRSWNRYFITRVFSRI